MYLLYDLVLLLLAPFAIFYYLLNPKYRISNPLHLRERLGLYENLSFSGEDVVWIHAASVGEMRAAIPLVKSLKASYPDCRLLLTNLTESGHQIASGIAEADRCLIFPVDLSWIMRRALRRIRPRLILIVETEIWPNLLREAKRLHVPVVLVNGRISDRSFPRYSRVRSLLRSVLEDFSALCMQTDLDAERIRQLGAPSDRVEVSRNLKFDLQPSKLEACELSPLRQSYALPEDGTFIWLAASTRSGEEEVLLDVFKNSLAEGPDLVLVLVPRHPKRCRNVAELLRKNGMTFHLRSQLQDHHLPLKSGEILLVDTLGEMLSLISASDVVFMGGSLVPVGGHNALEAAAQGRPVVFGPYMHNFREISRLLVKRGAGIQVKDGGELGEALQRLLAAPPLREEMGQRGLSLVEENAGATEKTLSIIQGILQRP